MDTIRAPRIPGTRRSGRFARWVAVLALAALAVVVFLPALVNGQVNRILRGVMARGVAEFRLVHAGLHRSDVAIAVDDGGTEGPPLEVASCVIAYRPLRLLAGHVDSATLGGVVLHVVATNGVFSVPAANLFAASDEPPEPFSLKRLLDLPVTLDRLSLGGHVVVHADGETLVIPVKVEAAIRNETGWDAIDASARLRFSSSALDVVVRCQPGAEAIHAQIRGHVASDALPVLLRAQLPEALRRAVVDMTAKTALSFDGAVLSRLDIEAQADVAAETTHGTFTLRPALTAAGDHEKIEASLTGLAADMGGVRIALDATNVVASLAKRTLEGTLALGIATNAPFAVSFNVTPGGFTAGLADSPGGAVSLGAIQATYAGVVSRRRARETLPQATARPPRDSDSERSRSTMPRGVCSARSIQARQAKLPHPSREASSTARQARRWMRSRFRRRMPRCAGSHWTRRIASARRARRPRQQPLGPARRSGAWNSPNSTRRSSRRRRMGLRWRRASPHSGQAGR